MLEGFQYGFKDWVGKDVLVIVQVAVGGEFDVDVVSLYCVKVCAFLLVVEDLHCVVYGVK